MVLSTEDLKKIIVGSGFIPEKDFDAAAKTSAELGRELLDVLIFRGLINEETVGKLISEHYGVPYINIKRQAIADDILALVPEKTCPNVSYFSSSKNRQNTSGCNGQSRRL